MRLVSETPVRLPDEVKQSDYRQDLTVAAVLSGNRNFEGRIHAQVKANYLASPPLVVAYALAGTVDIDLQQSQSVMIRRTNLFTLKIFGLPPKKFEIAIKQRSDARYVP